MQHGPHQWSGLAGSAPGRHPRPRVRLPRLRQSKSDRRGFRERARAPANFPSDVDRAVGFFATLPDIDINRLGVLGASCGGSQTLLLAQREPRVRAIGFFSSSLPGLTDQDLIQFESNTALPILGIAAEQDAGTFERTRRMFDSSSHTDTKLVVYKGALHGAPLLEHDPGLADSIVACSVPSSRRRRVRRILERVGPGLAMAATGVGAGDWPPPPSPAPATARHCLGHRRRRRSSNSR
jgi:hypothetical protein